MMSWEFMAVLELCVLVGLILGVILIWITR
jgi:hypothetical protein